MKEKVLLIFTIITLAITGRGVPFSSGGIIIFSEPEIVLAWAPKVNVAKQNNEVVYNPPSPRDAPDNIKDDVILGSDIISDTQGNASLYVGNKLNCRNCHFEGGITQGGKNGGISMVGVGATYPRYRTRSNAVVSLTTKVNDCFERSMNGKPLPPEGKEMTAILTYLQWISKDLPIYADIPWLGLKPLESDHKSDSEKGKEVFAQICSVCHGNEGQGKIAPPLWGDNSYNDGAKMSDPLVLAPFAYENMPRGNPVLSIEDALDVAAYVNSQPRPHFTSEGSRQ